MEHQMQLESNRIAINDTKKRELKAMELAEIQTFAKDLNNGVVVSRSEEPDFERLDVIGFLIEKVLDVQQSLNEKHYE